MSDVEAEYSKYDLSNDGVRSHGGETSKDLSWASTLPGAPIKPKSLTVSCIASVICTEPVVDADEYVTALSAVTAKNIPVTLYDDGEGGY